MRSYRPNHRYSRDPYTLTARYASPCAHKGCERGIRPGDSIFYFPATKSAFCPEHAEQERRDFQAAAFDEAMMSEGFC